MTFETKIINLNVDLQSQLSLAAPEAFESLPRFDKKDMLLSFLKYSSFWCGSSKYHRRAVSINGKGEDPLYRPIQRSNLPVIFRQLTHITALNISIIICNSKQLYLHNLHTLEEGNKPTQFFSTAFK